MNFLRSGRVSALLLVLALSLVAPSAALEGGYLVSTEASGCGGSKGYMVDMELRRHQDGEHEVAVKFDKQAVKSNEVVLYIEALSLGVPVYEDVYVILPDSLDGNGVWKQKIDLEVHDVFKKLGKHLDVKAKVQDWALENVYDCLDVDVAVKPRSFLGASPQNSALDLTDDEIDIVLEKWMTKYKSDVFLPEFKDFLFIKAGGGVASAVDNRKHIFKQNLQKIAEHNANPKHSWKMALNQFALLTPSEFKSIYASGYKPSNRKIKTNLRPTQLVFRTERKLDGLPVEVNWVEKGAVTPVKNQGACGSCWSFATTGAIEGAYFIKYGQLVSFSEEELVSCDQLDMGCNGGAIDQAIDFVTEKGGLCTEDSYPYTSSMGDRGLCQATCTPVANSAPKAHVDVAHDELSLMQAVAQQPVAVAIEADEEAFQFYSSGVLNSPCGQNLDHGVLVVGYGSEENVDYWLIKNSWGPQWGAEGFIKFARGVEQDVGGECGILLGASYPRL